MQRVDSTKRSSEGWASLAESVNDRGPSVESIAGPVPESESPHDPAKSIDANPDHPSRS